jgi:DNA-binding NarL/FixJ family response regulator
MLVDDQSAILAGLTSLVEGTGFANVVATETDADAAISTALDKRPDLILLDVSLGGVSGVDVAHKLFQQWPDARVLAVSAHADAVYVRGMLNAGASGYMLKDNGPGEIVDAIKTIMDDGQWIGEGLEFNPA